MTQNEYDKIINIINEYVETVWVTPYYARQYISNDKLPLIKERLKELVKTKDKQ